MYLLHKPSNSLVEILGLSDLWNPFADKVEGRFHAGEELQEKELFTKSHLVFPSGENLPLCWTSPNYRNIQFEAPTMAPKRATPSISTARYFAY